MNIGFTGCSYTYGTELNDPENTRWSKIVCDELGAKEFNCSLAGSSNEMICMRTIEELNEHLEGHFDFFVVQLTSSYRFSTVAENTFLSVGPNQKHRNKTEDLLSKIVYCQDIDYLYWYRLFRWKLVALHHFLNERNVNHMFTFMFNIEAIWIANDPTIPDSLKNRSVLFGLKEYCVKNNFEMGVRLHPLERGHESIAKDVILPKMKELL